MGRKGEGVNRGWYVERGLTLVEIFFACFEGEGKFKNMG